MSGLRDKIPGCANAAMAPADDESSVLLATMAMRPSVALRVEAVLKPNQPKARISVPTMAMGKLCPGMAAMVSSRRYLPTRGPSTIAPARAVRPPVMCTTDEPAKSTWPWPRPRLAPSCASQPRPKPSCRKADRGTWT